MIRFGTRSLRGLTFALQVSFDVITTQDIGEKVCDVFILA